MRSELDKLCERLKITVWNSVFGGEIPEGFSPNAIAWKVTLRFQGRSLSTHFFQGSAHTKEPTAADILSCLTSDTRVGDMTFEEFCSEFGYDVDSRKAENTWKACVKMAPRVRKFLGDAFDDVASAEH